MLDWFLGYSHHGEARLSPLGPEYLLNSDDQLSLVGHAQTAAPSPVSHVSTAPVTGSPAFTLVGAAGGLQIDLLWDASVQSSPAWSALEQAVVAAARIYTNTFSTHAVINIAVGLGEVGGAALSASALGQSQSTGYLTSHATMQAALASHDAALVQGGLMAAKATGALAGLVGESFFITSAEVKALNLVSPTSTGVDGYIGLTSSSALYFPASSGAIKPTQYDAVGVAAHELSEIMGRIGMEGQSLGTHKNIYTPLDVFRYSALNTPDTHPTAGYFSTDGGKTSLSAYNNPANGGDASDWASSTATRLDAFNAFGTPGVTTQVTASDLLEIAVLGYQIIPGHMLTTTMA